MIQSTCQSNQAPVQTSSGQACRAFGEHLNDWVEYLVALLDRTQASDYPESKADGIKYKHKRQLEWVLAFRKGLNASININFTLAHLYHGDFTVNAETKLRRHEPMQRYYEGDSPAFATIERALNAKDLFLLQGPPGTGKTTAIVEMVLQTLRHNPKARILICSETHVAVDNALDRLSACLDPGQIGHLMRHEKFKGDQFDVPELENTVTAARANQAWSEALEFAPDLTRRLLQRLCEGPEKVPAWVRRNLADRYQVIGVTCNQLANLIDTRSLAFDLAIVDECSKATLPEWLMPLSVASKGILVGDHKQLPPSFCSEETEVLKDLQDHQERLIRDGVIDRLFKQAPPAHKGALTTQYRMRPQIGEVVSQAFYDGQLRHGRKPSPSLSTESGQLHDEPIGWLTYRTECRFPAHQGGPLTNTIEVKLIARALARLAADLPDGEPPPSVAVITPYRAQKFLIREHLSGHLVKKLHIEIDTVDAFQGREADVVLFSFVRNQGSARFYGDPRRLNVALSRAKERILLVGSLDYLSGKAKAHDIRALSLLCELPVLEQHHA